MRIIGFTVRFDFFFRQLELDGQHTTQGRLGSLPVSGSGPITMSFNDFRVQGAVQINTLDGGYLNLQTLSINATVRSVDASLRGFGVFLDPTISLLISASLPSIINAGSESINELISAVLVPSANDLLNQYRLIDLILAIIPNFVNSNELDTQLKI